MELENAPPREVREVRVIIGDPKEVDSNNAHKARIKKAYQKALHIVSVHGPNKDPKITNA